MKVAWLILLATVSAVTAEDGIITYKLHNFELFYNPTLLPLTVVIGQEGKPLPIWSTPYNKANFITAAKVNDTVLQNGGNFVFPDPTPVAVCERMSITSISGGIDPDKTMFAEFRGLLCDKPTANYTLRFSVIEGTTGEVQISLSMNENTFYNQIRLSIGCNDHEQFYGFGVQYSVFNMKGRRLLVFLSEQGVGRGLEPLTSLLDKISPGAGGTWYTTYTSVPQYMTSFNRSMSLCSKANTVFDMTLNDTITIELTGNSLEGVIRSGDSILELITSYTADVGRLKPLPQWIGRGAVLGLQGGTEAVQKTLAQVEKQWGNLSDVVGVWLQDWTGQRVFKGPKDLPRTGLWWNWEVDSTHYPNWSELISELFSKGIRTLTYINPLFSNVTERGTPYTHNYLEEGLKNDYFIKKEDGTVWRGYGNSCMADLTQIEVVGWVMQMIIENMLKTGVCGWMCDFGESVPLQYKPTLSTKPDPTFHSDYPYYWGALNLNAIARNVHKTLCDPDDIVFFMRSGNYLSPLVSRAFWLGDQLVTWDSFDGLGTAVIGMLTGGLSGYSSTHSDIGGYTAIDVPPLKYVRTKDMECGMLTGGLSGYSSTHLDIGGYTAIDTPPLKYVRTKELFMRWCELAAFTTIYRTHLGTLPDENWQFNYDNETLQHFFKMAVVFESWGFYRQQLMEEAAEKGWPVARHMMLVFPHNYKMFELSEELKYQFMLGTELLVAPVLQPFNPTGLVPFARVFLPADTEWVHVWTNKVYHGADQVVTIDTPPGQPCVLYVSGSQVGKQFVQNLKNRELL